MTLRQALDAAQEGARTDESSQQDQPDPDATTSDTEPSPFSMDYDVSDYNIDDETLDRALSLAVTISNLI